MEDAGLGLAQDLQDGPTVEEEPEEGQGQVEGSVKKVLQAEKIKMKQLKFFFSILQQNCMLLPLYLIY